MNLRTPDDPQTVAVIAPASTMADLPMALRHIGIECLARLGFRVVLAPNVDRRHFHTAGTVEQRLDDLAWAIADPAVRVVMPVFGGYNSNQLLARLDYKRIAAANKIFVGYSDITALLLAIGKHAGTPVIHGPSFSTFCDPNLFPYTLDGFARVLRGETTVYESPKEVASDAWFTKPNFGPRELRPAGGWGVYRPGEVSASLSGGNLETLCALAGTPYMPELDGRVLLIEDARGDTPGAFHRNLTQLAQTGALRRAVGLVIGRMPPGSRLADEVTLRAILDDVLAPPLVNPDLAPVIYDAACSHVDPVMTLPLNVLARVSGTGQITVRLDGVDRT
jgi:muramoyltetrapeptide carboxypeptidase